MLADSSAPLLPRGMETPQLIEEVALFFSSSRMSFSHCSFQFTCIKILVVGNTKYLKSGETI